VALATEQTFPQVPQWLTSFPALTQAPPQFVCPAGQPQILRVRLSWTHSPEAQSLLPLQELPTERF